MEVKPGYKRTEVGVIPNEWDVKRLGTIGRVIRGSSPRPKADKRFYGGDVPRLMVEDVTRDRKYVTPSVDYLTAAGAKQSRPCKQGTLTVVCSGTPTVVGLPSILAVDACIHDGMLALVQLSRSVEAEYLFYRLTSLQESLHAAATHGGTFVNLTTTGLGDFAIALPSLPEQRAIVEALSDVDGLLGGLDRLIAKKRDLKQAAMQQLLTGQTRLPGFQRNPGFKQTDVGLLPEDWDVKPLHEIGRFAKGRGLLKEHIRTSGSIPAIPYTALYTNFSEILNYNHIYWFVDDETQTYIASEPCVLIASSSNMAANTGKASALTGTTRVAIGREVIVFKTTANCSYISFLLSTPKYRQKTLSLARGTTIKHLYPATFQNYKVAFPSLPEQTAIAEVLTDMDVELAALEQRREKTRALKQAMMQELLTGATRLVQPNA